MTVRLTLTTSVFWTPCGRLVRLVLLVMLFGVNGLSSMAQAQDAVDAEVVNEADLLEVDADGDATGDEAGEKPHTPEGGHTEDGHEMPPLLSFDFGSAIWNLLIFLLTLLILGVFVWPQILAGLQSREDKIHSEIASAEKANAEAKATLAGYQTQLAEAQDQIQEMMAEARKSAERVGSEIVEQAKADAERQRVRAIADIETAKSVAISELAGQTSDLAISLARQVVGRELNPQDHAELIRQSLDRLPSKN